MVVSPHHEMFTQQLPVHGGGTHSHLPVLQMSMVPVLTHIKPWAQAGSHAGVFATHLELTHILVLSVHFTVLLQQSIPSQVG